MKKTKYDPITVAFERDGVELEYEVYFFADPGWPGSHWEPPEPPEWGAEQILLDGEDVTDSFSEKELEYFDDQVGRHLERLGEEEQAAREDVPDYD